MLHEVQAEDLLKFGMIPEFVGRLPVIATLDELDEEALVDILTEPKNALVKQYQKLFEFEDVRLRFSEGALRAIARQALARKSGARGLRSILENVMLDLMYDIPSRDDVEECVINEEVIEQGKQAAAGAQAGGGVRLSRADAREERTDGNLSQRRRRAQRARTSPRRSPPTSRVLPLLPLRDIVVFPHMVVPLFVGRAKSIRALEEAMAATASSCCARSARPARTSPARTTSTRSGTLGSIIQLLRLPDGTVKVLVEGKSRAQIRRFVTREPFFSCEIEEFAGAGGAGRRGRGAGAHRPHRLRELRQAQQEDAARDAQHRARDPRAGPARRHHRRAPERSSSRSARTCSRPPRPAKRLEEVYARMQAEIEVLAVERKIRGRVKKQMERSQKEYYLNEQMRAIQKELGERDEFKNEIDELEEQLKKKKMPKEARERGREGDPQAQDDVADERRGDRRAQLHRLDPLAALGGVQGREAATSWRPSASSTRTTTGSRSRRSASSSTWRCRRWSSA